MIEVHCVVNDIFSSNCFIVSSSNAKSILLIDPGSKDCTRLLEAIQNRKIDYVIVTHGHFDHIAGIDFLRALFDFKIIAERHCSTKLLNPMKNLSLYSEFGSITAPDADIKVEETLELMWYDHPLNFFSTPGHSICGLSFSIGPSLFTGDTLLQISSPFANKHDGDPELLKQSIQFITDNFMGDTRIFPGHGKDFLLQYR